MTEPDETLRADPVSETGDDLPADVDVYDEYEDDDTGEDYEPGAVQYRGATRDPAFGYLIGVALSIGLSPFIQSGQAEMRYTLAWGVLALFGVTAWLFGNSARIDQETPDNVVWGVIFGLIIGAPLLAFGGATLTTAVRLLFGMMDTGTLLAYLVFVVPISETLFFRAVLQQNRPFWMIGLMGALWSLILFFPLLDLQRYPLVGVVIAVTLVMMNIMYGYVRQRNGLAAAWICQIMVNLTLIFIPFASTSAT